MLTVTMAPETIEAIDTLAARFETSRGRVIDAALRALHAVDPDGTQDEQIAILLYPATGKKA